MIKEKIEKIEKEETKSKDILQKIIDVVKKENVELDGAILCFTRKSDSATGTSIFIKNTGATLRLLEEAKLQRRLLDIGIEQFVAEELNPIIKQPQTDISKSYLG
jgi:hypothetical protein